ncbi:MAG: hypothetical protein Q8P89_01540 [bacterium]|nr:hypothetical protein [bacterium]
MQVETKRPNLRDLTGTFTPDVNKPKVENFWTPHRVELCQTIVEGINEELSPFGAPKVEFKPEQVEFLDKGVFDSELGRHAAKSGYISTSLEVAEIDQTLAAAYIHERLHDLSLRLAKRKGNEWAFRRAGLAMVRKPHISGGEASVLFVGLNDGVIHKTAQKIYEHHLSSKYPNLRYQTQMSWEIGMVDALCAIISSANQQKYPAPKDVFRVFQKATFGKGQALELARLIEKTYGKDGFKKLGEQLGRLPMKGAFENGLPTKVADNMVVKGVRP